MGCPRSCGAVPIPGVSIMVQAIGFIGLGQMGEPMAHNLLKAGFQLRVYNRTSGKAESLAKQGARVVDQPSQAAAPGGIVVTMLANDAALEAVVLGPHGIAEALGEGGTHISMSTISPRVGSRSM